MDYRVESKNGITVLTLNEKHLDHTLSALLKAELLILTAQDEGPMIIDLSKVKSCDSDGLAALLVAQRTHTEAGRALKIAAASTSIRKMMDLSRLTSRFEMYPSLAAAVRSCAKRPAPAKRKIAAKPRTAAAKKPSKTGATVKRAVRKK